MLFVKQEIKEKKTRKKMKWLVSCIKIEVFIHFISFGEQRVMQVFMVKTVPRENDRETWFWFMHLYFSYPKKITVRILGYK